MAELTMCKKAPVISRGHQRATPARKSSLRSGADSSNDNNNNNNNNNNNIAGHRSRTMIKLKRDQVDPHLAPLASLDCSITEPIADQSLTSTTDTPTLSGYFDCDQLSDMIDDSLFEITNAGCLSKTVFNGRKEEDPHQEEDREGSTTPTADMASKPSGANMIFSHQPFDYSSSSRIPARSERLISHNHHSPAQGGAIQRQRSKSARVSAPKTTDESSSSKLDEQRRRKARSNPDVREQDEQPRCTICQQQREAAIQGRKKEKKKFAFGFFNLFTNSDNNQDSSEVERRSEPVECVHRQLKMEADRSNNVHQLAERRAISNNRRRNKINGGQQIKSRDSIKLTNQRKQRNMKPTNPSSLPKAPTTAELLLDFTPKESQPSSDNVAIRSSHSSYSIVRLNRDWRCENAVESGRSKQTKSVKFTKEPDRVVMLPATSSSSNQLPPAHLQPTAPIIKRSVPKSSSYSQTEANKSLYEMLARYEDNNELIVELNEKLKLTEKIANPMSTLDDQEASGEQPLNGPDHASSDHHHEADDDDDDGIDLQNRHKLNINSCCEPNSCILTTSSDAEEAGFSNDWLNKQRAFV